ncbi:serine/threonine-protein kinase [Allocatelliglobosispora scoriae]|uniref:non-specific serine/threonine protein kinase n=1 Tax=Allocatelliglobosispora scoriae TaxID=643052 RepID=A0A841BI64_9ACTN|nr:serine/threonine-protein kinase [Allocatelliglobosispora scoriae]MBB5867964.1 serine/threonine-protein kinase [Allocatelliglobosispora scoriae]
MTDNGLRAGDLLGERYRLIDRIGAGGMSVIWRAKDETLDRLVAIKVLDPDLAGDERLRELARREAWAAARLNHPDVASVHDFVRTTRRGQEIAIIVLQLVPGDPLAEKIAMGPLPWQEAVRIGGRVATVLSVAHRAGVVHRDVTPDNIMVHGHKVTVLDFGIAARIGEPDDDSTGATFGTPAYVAPERLDGTPAQSATDIYALGVVLHEMLTGTVPFRVRGWEDVANDHGRPPAPAVAGLPRPVVEVLQRCLRRDPHERPHATELAMVLDRALAAPPRRWPRYAAVGGVVVLLAGFGTAWWLVDDPASPPSASPSASASPAPSPSASVSATPIPAGSATATVPASPRASTGGGTRPSASPPTIPVPVTPTVDEALATALETVDEGLSKQEIRNDVALDLRQTIRNMARNPKTRAQLDEAARGTREKIASREGEGSLSAGYAARLRADVEQLIAAIAKKL